VALKDLEQLPRNDEGISTVIGILKQRFGEQLKTSQALCEQHSHTTTYIPSQLPDAVVFVKSTEDVQEVVKTCAKYKVPIIPFGTGTSLEGGVNAPAGGISIDMNDMNQIVQVNAEDLDCVVQPGVTREALNEYLRDTGLFFPIDPGANASLGGMTATRASGTNAVRYGTMRENVINLTAVMPDGRIVKTANRARKTSAGYDLTKLMVGSEGTFGVITEMTLRLYGIPESMSAAVCFFDTVEDACNAVIMTMQVGVPVARIELLDEETVKAVNEYSKMDFEIKPMLLLEFHGSEAGVAEQAEMFGEIASDCNGQGFEWVSKPEERTRLWQARHDTYWAAKAQRPAKEGISTDVCVPISRLAECVTETQKDIKDAGLYGPMVGHVGDGNFHTLLMVDRNDPEEIARAEEVMEKMAMRAIAMEGTCTGEHGIGQGKRRFVRLEHGTGADIMMSLKQAIDPDNIMNPGKVVGF
jgi:D-lactate dehydrogenase (cytochrome)